MTDAAVVRRIASALPRAYEQHVGGHAKFKVGQIVFAALSQDERDIGFGFPRDERAALIDSAPDVFFLPPPRDLRYQWVCAHLESLDDQELYELVTDAWRMCVPRMLHELPELPEPAARAWGLLDAGELGEARSLLHPYLHWTDGQVQIRGRARVLAHLRQQPKPRPPRAVEVRDGQIYSWTR